MAEYPGSEHERRVPAADLADGVARIFEAAGMGPADAALLADSLVHADLRGIHSHGTLRVPDYVKKLTTDGVDPRAVPVVERRAGAAIVIDGANAMGQIAMDLAMRTVIEAAGEHGIAMAAIGRSNHCGAMDYWAMRALPHDMIGIAGTNALPTMAPWGGAEKLVGMNPLAIAVPAAEEPAIVLDAAFGMTAHGKIRVYAQKGEPIPEGWATDAQGNPTTDAVAALDGLILPAGGHKGIGIGIMVGLLSTLLADAGYGLESGNMEEGAYVGRDGQFAMAIKIDAFRPAAGVKARVDQIAREIRNSQKRPGVKALHPPGGLEATLEAAYRRDGIPLNDITLAGIAEAAAKLGVAVDFG
jgi:LDH2 family malate/lactate/ureidoglycolate dehydrogenase